VEDWLRLQVLDQRRQQIVHLHSVPVHHLINPNFNTVARLQSTRVQTLFSPL
jgi:hypothetical protein